MYSASFMWEHGEFDEEFLRLNKIIDEVARSLSGFMGVESWKSIDGSRKNATYYWDTLDTLKTFSNHPVHVEAKNQYSKWYKGYHVVVSEVLRSYGNDSFTHITPNSRKTAA